MAFEFADYQRAAEAILSSTCLRPETAVVLGSGLGGFAARLTDTVRLPYGQIPGFPISTAPSHAGEMVLGRLEGREVCVLSGRFHYYEGWSFEQSAFYVGVLKLAGIQRLILTNAAGGINPDFAVGNLMLIRDHINFSGQSPCRGPNIDELGPRFFDMGDAYTARLREKAKLCAARSGVDLKEGVYAYMTGPQYETPAEITALARLGADAVGMSTVPEVIQATHCALEVLGISLITNQAAGLSDTPLDGDEVTKTAAKAGIILSDYLTAFIKSL